ncbi:hypothetical protein [Luteimonas salinilitoris]|uniref:Uncharacterized protein n=1 Tax=Luteimonas salinilitoris TaxID=3237697 RepID=A0ABV4HT05_9GAMM
MEAIDRPHQRAMAEKLQTPSFDSIVPSRVPPDPDRASDGTPARAPGNVPSLPQGRDADNAAPRPSFHPIFP